MLAALSASVPTSLPPGALPLIRGGDGVLRLPTGPEIREGAGPLPHPALARPGTVATRSIPE